jgi:hypothetical protein
MGRWTTIAMMTIEQTDNQKLIEASLFLTGNQMESALD